MHKEILIEIDDYEQDLLDFWEQEMIEVFNSQAPAGYNCDSGGKTGGKRSEEMKKKITEGLERYHDKKGRNGRIWYTKLKNGQDSFNTSLQVRGENIHLGTYRTIDNAKKAIEEYKKTGKKLTSVKKFSNCPVIGLNNLTNECKSFQTIGYAARYIGVSKQTIWNNCTKKTRITKNGWTFEYTN